MLNVILYLIALALIHALWEVQVEGKNGWCKKLPTFRINVFFRKLLGGKALTGYHLYMLILFQIVFHGRFLFESWSGDRELVTQGLFIIYFVLEDILWFIVNPHYTIKRFLQRKIEWHKRWILGLPLTYWVGIIAGVTLIILGK